MFLKRKNSSLLPIVCMAFVFSFAFWGDANAAKLMDENVCILEHMGNTRSPIARLHISTACNFMSLHEASLLLNREQRDFHECVLKYLAGVEADLNATDLSRACRQLAWDSMKIP